MASPEALAAAAKEETAERVEQAKAEGRAPEPRRASAARPAAAPAEIVYDATNERVVLGAQIASLETRKVLSRTIAADELLVPEHVVMQRALRTMVDLNLEYDPQIFRRLIADEGTPVDEGYIASVEQGAEVPENLGWHVETLRWDATRARIVRGPVPELVRILRDPKATPDSLASAARAVLRAIEGGAAGRKHMRRRDELKREMRAEMAARVAGGNFYASGYEAIDQELVEGFMPGNTSAIVGLSGSGKSTFNADLAVKLAEEGRRVMYGAWEMPVRGVLNVMAAARARIPLERIIQGELDPEELEQVNLAHDWCADRITFMGNAFFDHTDGERRGRPSNHRSQDTLEGYIAESGCDVGIYDLWERSLEDLSYEGVTKALYRQQDMHRRYNFHGVIVHQLLLKDVEKRQDKRPTRESVKGSGAFVEVPDLLFGVHRDAQFKRVADDSLEIICLKQRNGKAFWAVRFDWAGEMSLITGGARVPYEPGLEASEEFGDVADVKVNQTRQRKTSRREK